jgi:H+/gluconate symporter-like permease
MCLSQFMDAYGWNSLIGFLIGLVTGVLTSYGVADYFKRKEELDATIQTAKDFSNDCHFLLDLTNKLIE